MSHSLKWQTRTGRSSKWIVAWRRLAIYMRDEFSCVYCGRDLRDAAKSEIALDHLIPQSKKKNHHESNLVTACRRCNCSRQHKPWKQFATGGSIARINRNRRRVLNGDLARAIIRGDVPRTEALNNNRRST